MLLTRWLLLPNFKYDKNTLSPTPCWPQRLHNFSCVCAHIKVAIAVTVIGLLLLSSKKVHYNFHYLIVLNADCLHKLSCSTSLPTICLVPSNTVSSYLKLLCMRVYARSYVLYSYVIYAKASISLSSDYLKPCHHFEHHSKYRWRRYQLSIIIMYKN